MALTLDLHPWEWDRSDVLKSWC